MDSVTYRDRGPSFRFLPLDTGPPLLLGLRMMVLGGLRIVVLVLVLRRTNAIRKEASNCSVDLLLALPRCSSTTLGLMSGTVSGEQFSGSE